MLLFISPNWTKNIKGVGYMSIQKDPFGNGSNIMDGFAKIGSITKDGEVKNMFGNTVGHIVTEYGKPVIKGAFGLAKEVTEDTITSLVKGFWR